MPPSLRVAAAPSPLAFGHVLDTKNGHRDSNCKILEEGRSWRAKERRDQWLLAAIPLPPWQNLNDVYLFLEVLCIPVGQFGEAYCMRFKVI